MRVIYTAIPVVMWLPNRLNVTIDKVFCYAFIRFCKISFTVFVYDEKIFSAIFCIVLHISFIFYNFIKFIYNHLRIIIIVHIV